MKANSAGVKGENFTKDYLERLGYKILQRNYHSKYGEIDIIAKKEEYLVFVEVKTRKESTLVPVSESISLAKMRRVVKTALCYMQDIETELQPRFDVSLIEYGLTTNINYIESAFDASVLGDTF